MFLNGQFGGQIIRGKRKDDNGTDESYEAEHLLERVASVLRLTNEGLIAPGDMLDFLYALRRRNAPSLAHLTFVATLAGNLSHGKHGELQEKEKRTC